MLDYSKLKIFGCAVYSHQGKGKLEPKSLKYVSLGYGEKPKVIDFGSGTKWL